MYGYIYKTTNLINNKIYIGQHKSSKFNPKYLGSGKHLRNAVLKYGRENFRCELLESADTSAEMNKLEVYYIELLNARDLSVGYNIHIGGNVQAGSANPMYGRHFKKSAEAIEKTRQALTGRSRDADCKRRISESRIEGLQSGIIQPWNKGKSTGPRSEESRKKASNTMKNLWHNDPDYMESMKLAIKKKTGQKRTAEFKEGQRKRAQGNTNVKGYKWYTNGIKSVRCIPGNQPEGFYRGKGGKHSNQYIAKKEKIS